ncbi:unnamed protein product, partial [Didymodactylos carnosus]
EGCAFTIMYNNHQGALDLMASDQHSRDTWVAGLKLLCERHTQKGKTNFMKTDHWILSHFYMADKDGSGTLTKVECQRLLNDVLCVKMPNSLFQLIFADYDVSTERALRLIEQSEMNISLKSQQLLGIDGFRNMLLTEEFDIINPWCIRCPYQDMKRYLFNNQVIGESSSEAYNRVLLKGGRAVERNYRFEYCP